MSYSSRMNSQCPGVDSGLSVRALARRGKGEDMKLYFYLLLATVHDENNDIKVTLFLQNQITDHITNTSA
jgi:hypothetical protein